MNNSKKLSFLLVSSIIGLPIVAQESTPQLKNRVAAVALLDIIDHADEVENLLVTTYNSLSPAEQQQIVTTLLNIFTTILQSTQTTHAQTTTNIQATTPTTAVSNQTASTTTATTPNTQTTSTATSTAPTITISI
jgi:hypothetical protein